jgi:eukaryotic-like serine/threonine-protein kinase
MPEEVIILNSRYRLLKRAGSGGMATVYMGQDLMLGRVVAIKLLHESLTGDQEFLRRFQKEAYAAANLTHPNIVTVHDIGQDGHRYYIVMEYIEGSTLKDMIRRQMNNSGGPLPLARSLDLAIEICAGIGYAHRANIVPCDVKLQNVLVTMDGRVKVADFGIARAISESSLHDDSMVWGTPQYFAPEQAAGESATPASDVYSIGIIMFEMLTGRLPFEADSHTALAVKHMRETPPPVTHFNPSVPAQIERIVTKVLSKEPAGRYRTAEQLGRILSSYRSSAFENTGGLPAGQAQPISEQPTAFYEHTGHTPKRPVAPPNTTRREMTTPRAFHVPAPVEDTGIDWTAVILGLIALAALLGLIPLWWMVYLRFTG